MPEEEQMLSLCRGCCEFTTYADFLGCKREKGTICHKGLDIPAETAKEKYTHTFNQMLASMRRKQQHIIYTTPRTPRYHIPDEWSEKQKKGEHDD